MESAIHAIQTKSNLTHVWLSICFHDGTSAGALNNIAVSKMKIPTLEVAVEIASQIMATIAAATCAGTPMRSPLARGTDTENKRKSKPALAKKQVNRPGFISLLMISNLNL